MKTLEQIKAQQNELFNKLIEDKGKDPQEILKQLKELEKEEKQARRQEAVNNFNRKYSALRDVALKIWESEYEAPADIVCNDGTLHKVKARKFPKLSALPWGRFKTEQELIIEVSTGGNEWRLYDVTYNGYEKPKTYTKPANFQAFLELNNVPVKDMTLQEYNAISDKLNGLNDGIKKAIDKYKQEVKDLGIYSLNYWHMADQSNENFYTYSIR